MITLFTCVFLLNWGILRQISKKRSSVCWSLFCFVACCDSQKRKIIQPASWLHSRCCLCYCVCCSCEIAGIVAALLDCIMQQQTQTDRKDGNIKRWENVFCESSFHPSSQAWANIIFWAKRTTSKWHISILIHLLKDWVSEVLEQFYYSKTQQLYLWRNVSVATLSHHDNQYIIVWLHSVVSPPLVEV